MDSRHKWHNEKESYPWNAKKQFIGTFQLGPSDAVNIHGSYFDTPTPSDSWYPLFKALLANETGKHPTGEFKLALHFRSVLGEARSRDKMKVFSLRFDGRLVRRLPSLMTIVQVPFEFKLVWDLNSDYLRGTWSAIDSATSGSLLLKPSKKNANIQYYVRLLSTLLQEYLVVVHLFPYPRFDREQIDHHRKLNPQQFHKRPRLNPPLLRPPHLHILLLYRLLFTMSIILYTETP